MNTYKTIKTLFNYGFIKYIGVGVINTVFGYGIYATLVFIKLPYLVALFLATIAGIVFNYFTFGRIVFNTKHGWFVFGKFLLSYSIVYVINSLLLSRLTGYYSFNAYSAQLLCIFPSIVISWLLMRFWVYKNRQNTL